MVQDGEQQVLLLGVVAGVREVAEEVDELGDLVDARLLRVDEPPPGRGRHLAARAVFTLERLDGVHGVPPRRGVPLHTRSQLGCVRASGGLNGRPQRTLSGPRWLPRPNGGAGVRRVPVSEGEHGHIRADPARDDVRAGC